MTILVVGVDFSATSKKALDAAVQLAKALGAGLVLVHANSPLPPGAKRGHLDPVTQVKVDADLEDVRKMEQTWAKQAGKSVDVEVVDREGKPEDVVVAVAKSRKAQFIVVGSHGRTGLKRVVFGSVAQAILAKSPIPVLVVPMG